MNVTRAISILKCRENHCEEIDDLITNETGLRILLTDSDGEENFALVHTLPTEYASLIIGLLFTSRLINTPREVIRIKVRNQLAKVQLIDKSEFREKLNAIRPTARMVLGICGAEEGALGTWRACDVPPIETTLALPASKIHQAIQDLSKEMVLYRKTGGTHGAALVDFKGKLVQHAEDIGRHNAIDRVIGKALQMNLDLSNLFLVCSGRLTGDLVLKAGVAQIPLVASISAGVSSGIELAEAAGITLIGFVRGSRMNIYTHPNRVKFEAV